MIIVSKDKEIIVNLNHIKNIYKGADGCTLKVSFGNTDGCQLSRYNSAEEANTAIEMLIDAIGKKEVFIMPGTNEVKAKIKLKSDRQNGHHIDGKKTKGYGGR